MSLHSDVAGAEFPNQPVWRTRPNRSPTALLMEFDGFAFELHPTLINLYLLYDLLICLNQLKSHRIDHRPVPQPRECRWLKVIDQVFKQLRVAA